MTNSSKRFILGASAICTLYRYPPRITLSILPGDQWPVHHAHALGKFGHWDWRVVSRIGLLALFLAAGLRPCGVVSQPIAILGGTIIDGNGGPPIKDGVIVIDGRRIVAVGNNSTVIPTDARMLDVRGKYVIPGLMDAQVHLVSDYSLASLARYEDRWDEIAVKAAQIALRSGVTTVFDSWGPRKYLVKAKDAVNEGRVVASRIYLAGNIIGLGGPYSDDFLSAKDGEGPFDFSEKVNQVWQEDVGPELLMMSPEEVRQRVHEYLSKPIDFVNYAVSGHGYPNARFIVFSPRVQSVIVEESHRAGLIVASQTTTAEAVLLALEAGADVMQHCDATLGQPLPQETVNIIVKKRVFCALFPRTNRALEFYRKKEAESYFDQEIIDINDRALIKSGARLLLSTAGGSFSSPLQKLLKEKDGPDTLLMFGEGHINWLTAVEEKGLMPMDALMAATRNIADAYKIDKDLGTLEKGKVADLVILNGDPLESAANYRRVVYVIKEGRIVDRDALPTELLEGPLGH